MTSQPDFYQVLRVEPTASQQEISRAYRALMRTHHPDLDVDGGATDGGELSRAELLQIMQAFSVLRDPARRTAYDRSRTGTGTGTGTATGTDTGTRTATGTGTRSAQDPGPVVIPVRRVSRRHMPAGVTIRITPVRWESGPWT
jgi:DnaJ-class molecular chaperone